MMNDLYLVHHGILGQKWGVRRYQNKDGTLTEAGKERLSKWKDKETSKVESRYKRDIDRSANEIKRYSEASKKYGEVGDTYRQAMYKNAASQAFTNAVKDTVVKETEIKAIQNAHLGDIKAERLAIGKKVTSGVLVTIAGLAGTGGTLLATGLLGGAAGAILFPTIAIPATLATYGMITAGTAGVEGRRQERLKRVPLQTRGDGS